MKRGPAMPVLKNYAWVLTWILVNLSAARVIYSHWDNPEALAGLLVQSPNQFIFLTFFFLPICFLVQTTTMILKELFIHAPIHNPGLIWPISSLGRILVTGSIVATIFTAHDYSTKYRVVHDLFFLEERSAELAGQSYTVLHQEIDPESIISSVVSRRDVGTLSSEERFNSAQRILEQRLKPLDAVSAAKFLAGCFIADRGYSPGNRFQSDPIMRAFDAVAIWIAHLAAWIFLSGIAVLFLFKNRSNLNHGVFPQLLQAVAIGMLIFSTWLSFRAYSLVSIERFQPGRLAGWDDLKGALFVYVGAIVSLCLIFFAIDKNASPSTASVKRTILFALFIVALIHFIVFTTPQVFIFNTGVSPVRIFLNYILIFIVVSAVPLIAIPKVQLTSEDFPILRERLFICYSRGDASWCLLFKKYLESESRQNPQMFWADEQIMAAENFEARIQRAIDESRAALLLVSKNFLASEFIRNFELPRLSATKHELGERFKIFWVCIDRCDPNHPLINSTQALHDLSSLLSEERSVRALDDNLDRLIKLINFEMKS